MKFQMKKTSPIKKSRGYMHYEMEAELPQRKTEFGLREAAQQALNLLQAVIYAEGDVYDFFHHRDLADLHWKVLKDLRAALKGGDDDAA